MEPYKLWKLKGVHMRKQIKFLLLALILFLSFSSLGFSCSSATLCTNACPKCDLSNAKLRKAYLVKADLRGTNLRGATIDVIYWVDIILLLKKLKTF